MRTSFSLRGRRTVLFVSLLLTFFFTSCKKDDYHVVKQEILIPDDNRVLQDIQVDKASGRLIVKSHDAFGELIRRMKSEPNIPISTRLKEYIGINNYDVFKSYCNTKVNSQFEADTLVTDPDFAALLNGENAIQVDNTVYRITPYGTFIYISEKEDKANEVIYSYNNGIIVDEIEKDSYLYEIEEGVLRYDTFQEMRDNTLECNELNYTYEPINSNPNEQNVKVYTIVNKHTIVGGWMQDTFGFTASYTRYFSSSRRVKVSFSSPNFVLFSYITVSIKMQKENWIGWSGINASELVLGWDGITYSFNNPIPIPENANPHLTWEPYNPNWTAYEIKPPQSNKTYLTFHLGNYQLSLTAKEVAKGYKLAFNYLKGLLSPAVPTEYLAIIFNPNEITISREEFSETNKEEIVKTLDYSIGHFKFKWNMSGSIGVNNFSVSPMSFTIKNASIFGMAKFGGEWLGIRIEKL